MSEDAAHACVRELGQLGCIQFNDLNPELTPFQRRYVAYIKRCDEIERKIRYVHGEVKKMGVPVQSAGSVENFVEHSSTATDKASASSLLEGLESKLDHYEQQLLDLNKYSVKLTEEFNNKVEFHHVLLKARTYFMAEVHNLESGVDTSGHSDIMTPLKDEKSLSMVSTVRVLSYSSCTHIIVYSRCCRMREDRPTSMTGNSPSRMLRECYLRRIVRDLNACSSAPPVVTATFVSRTSRSP